jgi:hypothetical protein
VVQRNQSRDKWSAKSMVYLMERAEEVNPLERLAGDLKQTPDTA